MEEGALKWTERRVVSADGRGIMWESPEMEKSLKNWITVHPNVMDTATMTSGGQFSIVHAWQALCVLIAWLEVGPWQHLKVLGALIVQLLNE